MKILNILPSIDGAAQPELVCSSLSITNRPPGVGGEKS